MVKQNDKNYKLNKSTTTHHPQAIYTSRLLDFENLPEPKNANDNSKKINEKPFNATKITNTSSKNIKENKSVFQKKIIKDNKNENLTKIDKYGRELPIFGDKLDLRIPEDDAKKNMQKHNNKKSFKK